MTNQILLTLIFLFTPSALGNGHVAHVDSHTAGKIDLRYFKKQGKFRWMSELHASNAFGDSTEHHLDLGFNYRWASFSKIGLTHRLQHNVRNEDNWVWEPSKSDWEWNEKDNGYESVLIPKLDFRWMLSDQLRAEFVFKYIRNNSNSFESIAARPGLNYFWFRQGSMFANIYLQYEQVKPLNFGNGDLAEEWIYLGFLYHLTRSHKMGINASFGKWIWTDSDEFESRVPNEDYEVEQKATMIGLVYIFTH